MFLEYYGNIENIKKIKPELKITLVLFVISFLIILLILFIYKKNKIKIWFYFSLNKYFIRYTTNHAKIIIIAQNNIS